MLEFVIQNKSGYYYLGVDIYNLQLLFPWL